MKNYAVICDAPGLPLSKGSLTHAEWPANERLSAGRIRGGALIAPKQMTTQGTSVRTVQTVDFPYLPVRAEAQGLT